MSLVIILLLSLIGAPVFAANHYVRAGATGTDSGNDWTNACPDFTGNCASGSLTRGDTYYVATGTYLNTMTAAAHAFNPAVSGTSVVTIKGATTADHGTETGWNAAYSVSSADGGAQAHFKWYSGQTYGLGINTSYVVFDGAVGSMSSSASAYGFIIDPPSTATVSQTPALYIGILDSSTTTTDVTVKHVAFVGTDPLLNDIDANAFQVCGNPGYCTNITLSHNFSDKTVKFLQASSMSNSTIEYNYIKTTGANYSAHAEHISSNNCHNSDGGICTGHTTQCTQNECASSNTVRYNYFGPHAGSSVTGGIVALDGNPRGLKDWKIYGNVFYGCGGGNGCIATGTSGDVGLVNVLIYNNSFVSSPAGNVFWQCGGTTACAVAGGNIIKNNLLYDSYSVWREADGGGAITHNYNAYCSPLDTPPTETNRQVGCGDLFVDSASGGNYHLSSATNAGEVLSSPYDIDRDGVARGTDGTWDRGAYEYDAEGGGSSSGSHPSGVKKISPMINLRRGS